MPELRRPSGWLRALAMPGRDPHVGDDQGTQDQPEKAVVVSDAKRTLEPEKLVSVQEPRYDENEHSGQELRAKLTAFPHGKVGGEIEDLDHEVLPVDIRPPP